MNLNMIAPPSASSSKPPRGQTWTPLPPPHTRAAAEHKYALALQLAQEEYALALLLVDDDDTPPFKSRRSPISQEDKLLARLTGKLRISTDSKVPHEKQSAPPPRYSRRRPLVAGAVGRLTARRRRLGAAFELHTQAVAQPLAETAHLPPPYTREVPATPPLSARPSPTTSEASPATPDFPVALPAGPVASASPASPVSPVSPVSPELSTSSCTLFLDRKIPVPVLALAPPLPSDHLPSPPTPTTTSSWTPFPMTLQSLPTSPTPLAPPRLRFVPLSQNTTGATTLAIHNLTEDIGGDDVWEFMASTVGPVRKVQFFDSGDDEGERPFVVVDFWGAEAERAAAYLSNLELDGERLQVEVIPAAARRVVLHEKCQGCAECSAVSLVPACY